MTASWFADELLAAHAREAPDALALVDRDRSLTWAELDGLASSIAMSVEAAGVRPGERVALLGPSGAVDCAAILGILRAGAVVAPVPAGLTARETATALDVLSPSLVLRLADPVPVGQGEPGVGAAAPARDPEAPAVVVLTSGTTGRPKGVVLSARAMAASADSWMAALPPATGWLMPLGLGHVAGLGILWRAIRDRVPVRIVPGNDPLLLLAALQGSKPVVSHVSLVSLQLVRALDEARGNPPPVTLKAALLGGGPLSPDLVLRALRSGWPVVPTYGLSETASGATALATDDAWDLPGSAGVPLPGVHLALAGEDATGVGEIVIETGARFSGYLGERADPAPADAPLRTGDLGRLDRHGRLTIVDRRVDRIVRGGENISPAEVEAALTTHPAILDACVVGAPDDALGQVPVAAVVLREGAADPGDAALTAHARGLVAKFKVPVSFTRLDTLPRTASGKLRREALRPLLTGGRAGTLPRPGGDAIGWRVTGDGPTQVLLLHGTVSSAAQLDRLAAALAPALGATVHAIDRRGHGTSTLADPTAIDAATHVDDLVAYLDARGIGRVVVVGHSFGGVVGLELAARHRDRVRALAVYEPPYGQLAEGEWRAWFERVATDTAAAHATGGAAQATETFLRMVAGDAAWNRLPERARGFLRAQGDGALADSSLRGLDPEGLRRIAAPTLLLTGAVSEPFYAPIADTLAARIHGARRATLPAATHTTPITDPAPVVAAIRDLLELPA